MKKVLLIALILILCVGCKVKPDSENPYPDATQFEMEYEEYNLKANPDNGKIYPKLDIPYPNPIHYSTYAEINDVLDGTGVIYLGFPNCPWCRNAVPVLLDVCEELEIDTVYYLNNREDRDSLYLDDNGEIVTEEEGTEEYKKLLEKLGEYAEVYDGLENEEIKRIYFPTVIVVKRGEILLYHTSTVESQEDPYTVLNSEQYNELKELYTTAIKKMKINGCSVDKKC